jgi:hypothetical protein
MRSVLDELTDDQQAATGAYDFSGLSRPRTATDAAYDFSGLTPPRAEQPASDEPAFRRWYASMAQRYGLHSDPDGPEQLYDYRAAFRAGAEPDASGHWPSAFKQPGHPNEVVGGFNTRTGERVPGTARATEAELVQLGWEPETAAQLARTPEPSASTPIDTPLRPIAPMPAHETPQSDLERTLGIVRTARPVTPHLDAQPPPAGGPSIKRAPTRWSNRRRQVQAIGCP